MITKYDKYIKESNAKDSKAVDSYFLQTYEETKAWLDSMNIRRYTINDDLTVDVYASVNISCSNLTKLPVQFNKVVGYFSCNYNNLTSLKGCPIHVIDFYCAHNKLTNLKYLTTILDYVDISNNPLENINDLDSETLIESFKCMYEWTKHISTEVCDRYFDHWIDKDINIFEILKDKVSDYIKEKYKHLFNANNFDIL